MGNHCVWLLCQRSKTELLAPTASTFERPAWATAVMSESVTNIGNMRPQAELMYQESMRSGSVSKLAV